LLLKKRFSAAGAHQAAAFGGHEAEQAAGCLVVEELNRHTI